MTESEKTRNGALLAVVVVALGAVLWIWLGRPADAPPPAPKPAAGPAMRPSATPKPTRTPAVPRVANPAVGDVNADGKVDKDDVTYLADAVSGAGQQPLGPADVNADGSVNSADVFYLTNFVFAGGPAPKTGKPSAKKAP